MASEMVRITVLETIKAELLPSGHRELPAWEVVFSTGSRCFSLICDEDEFDSEDEVGQEVEIEEARELWYGLAGGGAIEL